MVGRPRRSRRLTPNDETVPEIVQTTMQWRHKQFSIAVLAFWASASFGAALADAQITPPRMLVMPFDAGREPRAYWLGEASAVLLADALKDLGVDAIARDERIRAFARLQVPSVGALTHGTVIRVGELVGASSVIVGSLALEGDTISVRARSIRLDTGRLQAQVEERARREDLFGLYQRIARRLATGGREAPASRPTDPPLAAFENHIKGLLAETPAAQITFQRKAIELFPAYDAARLALWRAHTDAGEPEQALAAATALTSRTPGSQQAQFAAAFSEIQLKRHDDAFRRLRALADRAPSAAVFNNLGVVQTRRDSTPETGKATYWFNRAATTSRTDADYYFNLGYAYWLEADGQAAIYWLREALRRNPADAEAHFVMAAALRAAGSVTEADRELELARRLSADYERDIPSPGAQKVPRGLERIKSALDGGGERIDTALIASAQREQRELAGFHLDRGRRLFEAENDGEATTELRRALYLSPYQPEAHLLLGRIYLRSGRTREAIDALKISLWSAEGVEAHVALAEAYLQAHDADGARKEIDRALELDPQAPGARAVLERLRQP
jgi:Flp pilus assembly protein TadD